MSRSHSFPLRPARRSRLALAGLAGVAFAVGIASLAPQAWAQSAVCLEGGKIMQERKELSDRLPSGKNKKVEPRDACAIFGKLATNGTTLIKWADANKDWCGIPEGFVERLKTEHGQVTKIRGQACGAAAKQAEMEKRAKQQGGQQGGLLGGGGLEGTYRIPQGAL
jgi:hypothetical protein